jgi:hypothetical protein
MAQTCESCRSIDVREWARRGYLHPNQQFSWSWSHGGEPCGSITVPTGPTPNFFVRLESPFLRPDPHRPNAVARRGRQGWPSSCATSS